MLGGGAPARPTGAQPAVPAPARTPASPSAPAAPSPTPAAATDASGGGFASGSPFDFLNGNG
jgi:hypothetical protein